MLKHFAKKSSSIYPFFFSAKREKFCCLNQRRILRKFFQTKQPFAKSFSFFVSNEAPMSCFLTLHFNIFFRKWILHLAESLCNKEKQQHAEYLFAVSRKRKLILQQNLKRILRKSSTQQQDYFTVNAFRTSSNQRQPFLQKQANQTATEAIQTAKEAKSKELTGSSSDYSSAIKWIAVSASCAIGLWGISKCIK